MQTIRVVKKADKDGTLLLQIPLGKPEVEYDVTVVLQSKSEPDRGWPPGYFDKTYGSIDDDTFIRHPQGELPKPVELD
jgi:hypothetical protein